MTTPSKSILRAMKVIDDADQKEPVSPPPSEASAPGQLVGRSIGDLIGEMRKLDQTQIEQILKYQRQHPMPFGEAAIALKLATREDVLWALSQQFHYPYPAEGDVSNLNGELIAAIDPFSDESEIFRDVRSQLLMGVMAPDQPPRALAVMSPNVGDGKTFFAANIAIAFSQLGGRTLLIDADMRTPRLHEIFGIAGRVGLSGILAERVDVDVIHQVTALPGLYLLPVGTRPPNPLELIQRPSFGLLIHEVCAKFDYVIVDTPAATHGADARVLAAKCGAAMVIGRRGKSRMDAMHALVTQIQKNHARLAGVMLNEH